VVGGGAAGYFAAIHAAENGATVVLLEKGNKVLAKVKVSGGGRCNVTNNCEDPSLLIKNYPRGNKELRGPFSRFHTTHTFDWFETRGVKLKSEFDGRVFPVTDSSQTIIECLENEARKNNVRVHLQTTVLNLKKVNGLFEIETTNGNISADNIIIATGGSPNADSYKWLGDLGHKIIAPVPSLFTFNMPGSPFLELMGVSVQLVKLKIENQNFTQDGPLLFTHWGISGPAVLKLSAWAAKWLNEQNYKFNVLINFMPHIKEDEVREQVRKMIQTASQKKILSSRMFDLPARLWEKLCLISGANEQSHWAEVGKVFVYKLVNNVTALSLSVNGKTTFKEEFVTCGGVDLKDVDMKTMQSKKVPGLYFAGEVLDIDGITGGFNFQAAWTSGYIAGVEVG